MLEQLPQQLFDAGEIGALVAALWFGFRSLNAEVKTLRVDLEQIADRFSRSLIATEGRLSTLEANQASCEFHRHRRRTDPLYIEPKDLKHGN